MVLEDSINIRDVSIENVCKNGYIVWIDRIKYAIHYNVTLAVKMNNKIFLNKKYLVDYSPTKTDLKTIRGLDDTFRKKDDKYISERYEIIICDFNYGE